MKAVALTTLALCLSTAAAIADDDSGEAITYHVPGVTTVIQEHKKPINLKKDPKITWLNKPFTYDCLSANCLVTVIADEQSGSGDNICVYTDGRPMSPSLCSNSGYNMQYKIISQGTHSFHTQVKSFTFAKRTVCPCIVTFSIYDSGG